MRLTCRRPGWESEDQVQFRPTRLKRLSQSWFSRSGLLTVAPSLSFDPPTPRQPRGRDGAYTAATGARYTPPLASSAQTIRAILLASATRTSIGLAGEHAPQPRASRDALAGGPAGHRAGADDQQASQRALAHLGCLAEPLLAPARALNRGQPEPSREIATAPECVGRWGQRRESRRCHGPDPRDGHQPTRHCILFGMPGDLPIEHSNALVQRSEFLDQHSQNGPSRLGQIGGGVLQGSDELGRMDRPFGGDHPELGQVAPERVDGLGALANQQVAGAEHDGCGLLVRALEGYKAHGGTLSGLADRFGIRHVVLLSLDERLHVRRRDQLHRVAELGDLAAPIMRAATGLHGHRAGRQRCQEREELAAAQLLAKDHRARAVSPMELKDVLGEIEADGAHLVQGRLLEWALTPPLWHAEAVGGRPYHQAHPGM